jgi:AcrR family transcriptional regulator
VTTTADSLSPDPAGLRAAGDFRRRPRRRGQALEQPIYTAVLAELAEFGFARMSLERVAARAGTGKSAIYRRWDTKLDLVVDTLIQEIPRPAPAGSSGSLHDDLLVFFRQMAQALAGPAGTAICASIGDIRQHPELRTALREQVIEPRQAMLRDLITAAIARGEARPAALAPECLDAGPALLRQHIIEHGPPIPDQLIVRIVDNALIPMLRPLDDAIRTSHPVPAGDR